MTPDELRVRCAAVTTRIIDMIEDDCLIDYMEQQCQSELESLCREMLAAGLERAGIEAERRQAMILAPGYHIEFDSGFRCACYDLQYLCREEAQRVKEGLGSTYYFP